MSELGNTSDIPDPFGHGLFQSLHEVWVLNFVFEVISGQLSTKLLDLFVLGLDFWIMDQLDLWNHDILLVLDEMHLQLGQIFLYVLEPSA